jgi:large subunit ribosomal protein L20
MARVKRGVTSHARHKKVLKLASGYRGRSSTCYRIALQRVEKALSYVYRDRRCRKRDMRALWIQRINAAARKNGITYSDFMYGLKKLSILLNRKMLSDLAVVNFDYFTDLAEQVKNLNLYRPVFI